MHVYKILSVVEQTYNKKAPGKQKACSSQVKLLVIGHIFEFCFWIIWPALTMTFFLVIFFKYFLFFISFNS